MQFKLLSGWHLFESVLLSFSKHCFFFQFGVWSCVPYLPFSKLGLKLNDMHLNRS